MTGQTKTAVWIGAAVAVLMYVKRAPVGSVTTSEGFDLSPYGGPVVYPESIKAAARAIAKAEGFYVAGSIPQRANNPGDLKPPNWTGPTLGNGIAVYASADAGWSALYKQLYIIVTGGSSRYTLDDTILDMARTWTGGDNAGAWARQVASQLGVADNAPLWSVLA